MRLKSISKSFFCPFADREFRVLTVIETKGGISEYEILVPEPDFLDEGDHEYEDELNDTLTEEDLERMEQRCMEDSDNG